VAVCEDGGGFFACFWSVGSWGGKEDNESREMNEASPSSNHSNTTTQSHNIQNRTRITRPSCQKANHSMTSKKRTYPNPPIPHPKIHPTTTPPPTTTTYKLASLGRRFTRNQSYGIQFRGKGSQEFLSKIGSP
jgi:hypothetical protein